MNRVTHPHILAGLSDRHRASSTGRPSAGGRWQVDRPDNCARSVISAFGIVADDGVAGSSPTPSYLSTIGAAADFEFHPVGVPKEQRPLIAQPLDVAHLLCARGGQALFDHLERGV